MLFDIADLFSTALSKPTKNFPIRFSDNDQNLNSVLNLVFTRPSSVEFNCHYIYPDWRLTSDHALITVNVPIRNEYIPTKQWSLVKGSNKENQFIEDPIQFTKNLNTLSIQDTESLEEVVQLLTTNIENIWFKHLKTVNITRYSKVWWNKDCHYILHRYRQSHSLENWKNFKSTIKKSKCFFFNEKIDETANKKCDS